MNPPITIRGAREHNLKSIDLDLPRGGIIAFCGPSGSGKSSLAVDTLYAESRRRFLDCLSPQARQHLAQPDKPDVTSISGLPPALCLEQSAASYGPRALLGSLTEILDYLRIIYAAIGVPHDPASGKQLVRQTSDQVMDSLLSLPEGTKLTLLSPVPERLWSDGVTPMLGDFLRQGFLRLFWNGEIRDIDDMIVNPPETGANDAALVIDRIVVKGETSSSRLSDSIEMALRLNPDEIKAMILVPGEDAPDIRPFHFRYMNPDTGFVLPQLSPRNFSFNSPQGYCPQCQGLGIIHEEHGKATQTCPSCQGLRLNPMALAVTLEAGGETFNIAELAALTVEQLLPTAGAIDIPRDLSAACAPVIDEIVKRLSCLEQLGLGYLSLNRPISSLSGGEIQRTRLASQLGGGLSGVLYILDEPTTGLHPSDVDRLTRALDDLKMLGNTVLVVEHDKQVLMSADLLVDMGPGSGIEGGQVLAQGTPEEMMHNPDSLTGSWLSGKREMLRHSKEHHSDKRLVLEGANAHNLQNVTLSLPLGIFTCIAGPSGSGKSSLIQDCLIPALKTKKAAGQPWTSLKGADQLSRHIVIDQSPIGKSSRSTPATATGILDILRPLFAQLPLSKQRGYTAARFSTNVRGGRCERCLGMGFIQVDMNFLGNISVPCGTCRGKRYNRETLEITWRGKSIADILAMTVEEAGAFFEAIPKIKSILTCMSDLGLGYLSLDRSSDSLSGGESQRIKIAAELSKVPTHLKERDKYSLPPALFILDEPTSGLHFQETAMLLSALYKLRDAGHTILCVEHNTDVLAAADHLIDMGPGAGDAGGRIVFEGSPRESLDHPDSPTGKWLKSYF